MNVEDAGEEEEESSDDDEDDEDDGDGGGDKEERYDPREVRNKWLNEVIWEIRDEEDREMGNLEKWRNGEMEKWRNGEMEKWIGEMSEVASRSGEVKELT